MFEVKQDIFNNLTVIMKCGKYGNIVYEVFTNISRSK